MTIQHLPLLAFLECDVGIGSNLTGADLVPKPRGLLTTLTHRVVAC